MKELRISGYTSTVLTVMLRGLGKSHYGYDLIRQTGIGAGTLYPLLARLEQAQFIRAALEEENTDSQKDERRRYYVLTESGERIARAERDRILRQIGLSATE